jgi:hypothetical protein
MAAIIGRWWQTLRSGWREAMLKFEFSVKTRDGQKIESVVIHGKDMAEAERKLRQMYHYCEVTHCKTLYLDKTVGQSIEIEELLSLIARQE